MKKVLFSFKVFILLTSFMASDVSVVLANTARTAVLICQVAACNELASISIADTVFSSPASGTSVQNTSLSVEERVATQKGKVVLVAMDRIGWEDIKEASTPNIDRLIEMGAVGLMTTNTAGSRSCENLYVTMGAGARITGSITSPLAFSSDDMYQGQKVADLYYQITGHKLKDGSIACIGIAGVYRNNAKRPYPVKVGALGTALAQNGYEVAVIGNSDIPEKQQRYLVSMMMDDKGVVSLGDVGEELNAKDSSRPYGIKLDFDRMAQAVERVWDEADVVAIEWGDTYRVEAYRHMVMDDMVEEHRRRAIEEGDAFIGWLMNRLDMDRDLIIIFTALGPLRELQVNNRLTPVIMSGKGVHKGWLTSASTHRMGVVTNLDVGVTVLDFLGISPLPEQGGAPMRSVYNSSGLDGIMAFNQRLVEIFNQRPFLIRAFVFYVIAVVMGSLLVLLFKRKYLRFVKFCLLFAMVVPFTYLVLPLVHQSSLVIAVLIAMVSTLLLTIAICKFIPDMLGRIMAVCLMTAMALVIDQWTGAKLIQGSPLGYDVISGARFYGIGNEYMGVLVGAACIGSAGVLERLRGINRYVILCAVNVFLVIVLAVLALPWWGTNVGGAITAFAAFGVFFFLIAGLRITWKQIAALAVALIIAIVGLFILDSFRAVESQSHIGQTVRLIRGNGVQELLNIAYRKVSMNIRLFRYTIWSRVFLSSLLAMIVLFYRPKGIFKDVKERYPGLYCGFVSGIVGSVVAFAFNDSGIVAAATCMIYVGLSFIFVIAQQIEDIELSKKDMYKREGVM
ncbi:hypothetical protein JOD02_001197 [Caldicoprobacter guelmensis]|uniref:hypothetical protein n=1 Tax=Caldicoprobacter guelmensis TaxID=1170224 RepID=UPI00195A4C54|nr:hypothetical protein [Caldicoprobacter guelmensis]MBM7582340.1 hypothetical protein [Caldicoprobacter guelmensis]